MPCYGDSGELPRVRTFFDRHFTVSVLTASSLLQVLTVIVVGNQVSGGDAFTYLAISKDWTSLSSLLSPDAFEQNFWPAGYPGFLALFSGTGEHQLLLVRLAQVAMVVLIAWMSADLARAVSPRAARWTLVIVAFSPTLVWGVWAIGYEVLLGVLLVAGLWLVWPEKRHTWQVCAGGLVVGLALVVQFRAVTVVPLVALLAWRVARVKFWWWALGLAVPVLAWSARSFIATGSLSPASTNGGYNLWNGNGPHATGHNVFPLPPVPEGATTTSAALDWIQANPAPFMELVARKSLFLFYPTEISGISDIIPGEGILAVAQWLYSLVVLLLIVAFAGALFWRIDTPLTRLWPLLTFALLYLLPNVIFIVEARFRIPVEGLILAIAASTAEQHWSHRQRYRNQQTAKAAAGDHDVSQ